jgi:hypothetical protein
MQIRMFLLACATIAAISPAVSNASPETAAVNACANALASSVATAGDTRLYQVKYRHSSSGPLGDYYGREYTFDLQARDAKNGLLLGRATCSATRRGSITAFTPVSPLEPSTLALAARK